MRGDDSDAHPSPDGAGRDAEFTRKSAGRQEYFTFRRHVGVLICFGSRNQYTQVDRLTVLGVAAKPTGAISFAGISDAAESA
jgi:hypothetical protein